MNPAPDYSAAYVVLRTDHPVGLAGHGLAFTIGRGTEIVVAAINALAPLVQGVTLESLTTHMGAFWRRITGDSQLRWIGPKTGAIHLATAAIVNAVWDLWAKVEGQPVWKLLADMTPETLVSCIDFRYITDALSPEEALAILWRNEPTKVVLMKRLWFADVTMGRMAPIVTSGDRKQHAYSNGAPAGLPPLCPLTVLCQPFSHQTR